MGLLKEGLGAPESRYKNEVVVRQSIGVCAGPGTYYSFSRALSKEYGVKLDTIEEAASGGAGYFHPFMES